MNQRIIAILLFLSISSASRTALLASGPDKPPAADESHDDLHDLVQVTEDKTADHGVTVWATNKSDFPVTVRLDSPSLDNLTSSVKLPVSVVVHPRKKQLITRLSRVNGRQATRYAFQWTYHWGWRTEKPVDYLYTLPYQAGYAYRIAQGFNGSFSHQGKNALDFLLPDGATICAARGGVVIEVVQHNTEGGISEEMRSKANRILILHDDGSIGRYAHLQHDGALVKVGQNVKAGDAIGRAGATGYAQGPHLHFEIDRPPLTGAGYETVAMQFIAQVADGAEMHVSPKESDVLMRPFAPSDVPAKATKRWPTNAIEELRLCRNVAGNAVGDAADTFRADDTLCIFMRVNMPAEYTVNVTIAPQSETTSPAPASAPATQPLYRHELKCDVRGGYYFVKIALANLASTRGRFVVQLACDGNDLASKPFTVRDE